MSTNSDLFKSQTTQCWPPKSFNNQNVNRFWPWKHLNNRNGVQFWPKKKNWFNFYRLGFCGFGEQLGRKCGAEEKSRPRNVRPAQHHHSRPGNSTIHSIYSKRLTIRFRLLLKKINIEEDYHLDYYWRRFRLKKVKIKIEEEEDSDWRR